MKRRNFLIGGTAAVLASAIPTVFRPGLALAADRKPITKSQFMSMIQKVAKDNPTTIEYRDRVQYIARRHYVRRVGKVLDIKPVDEAVDVECTGIYGEPPGVIFTVPGIGARIASNWRRWDRLAWPCDISDAGEIALSSVSSIDDLEHAKNPGLRYPPVAKPLQRIGKFPEWLLSYAGKTSKWDWSKAWRIYDRARRKIWGIQGTVVEVHNNGTVDCDIEKFVAVRSRQDNMTWGIINKTHTVEIVDPQVMEALKVGSTIELHLDIDGIRDPKAFRNYYGELPINLFFGRISSGRSKR
jgi:hypothetical protein